MFLKKMSLLSRKSIDKSIILTMYKIYEQVINKPLADFFFEHAFDSYSAVLRPKYVCQTIFLSMGNGTVPKWSCGDNTLIYTYKKHLIACHFRLLSWIWERVTVHAHICLLESNVWMVNHLVHGGKLSRGFHKALY